MGGGGGGVGGGGRSVLRCPHFGRFRVTVANDYKVPGCVLFFRLNKVRSDRR